MTNTRIRLTAGAAFIIVVVLLGNLYEAHQRRGETEDRALFSAKLRCQTLGTKYSIDDAGNPIFSILQVDYSRALHSCIALTENNFSGGEIYMVVDLITSQVYGADECEQGADCDRRNAEIMKHVNAAFSQAVAGEIKPLGP
jgi:hypothetical protein